MIEVVVVEGSKGRMLGWGSCCLDDEYEEICAQISKPFSLPAPLPKWPQDQGFANEVINLGALEVLLVTEFERVWSFKPSKKKSRSVSFYKPINVSDGFFTLGHYCQLDDQLLRGYLLVARELGNTNLDNSTLKLKSKYPALTKPLSYSLVCSSESHNDGHGHVWLPNAPIGYKSLGFLVTTGNEEPELDEIRCVRDDLTESCETTDLIISSDPLHVWSTRPCKRSMFGKGVPVGTFYCSQSVVTFFDCLNFDTENDPDIACLKNLDLSLSAMPKLDQIHELIKHYGPTVYFHPDEKFWPSSVSWFFDNGALLYRDGQDNGVAIDSRGSNLPSGGECDGEFWLDLPADDGERNYLKAGAMDTAKLYVHVKPALGGSFTDIAMWIFCPFNGPAAIKAGKLNIELDRIGEHVGDWEHFTLRINNFTGELWCVYFSEHSGGEWIDARELEFIEGNKPIVYSSKHGHASFPHPGCYLQGPSKFGIGARNDCAKSKYSIDSSTRYEIIAAEYLGKDSVSEPDWLQYMREWGPTIVYNAREELDKIINHLPFFFRFTVESLFELFPTELYGEEGPTGPKEKDNWIFDERC